MGRTALLRSALVVALLAMLAIPLSVARAELPVLGRFIVVLDDDVTDVGAVARAQVTPLGGRIGHVYQHALKGYSVTLPEAALATLRLDQRVASIERDSVMRLVATQSGAPWGLDRIDQRSRPLNGTFTYTATGSGVDAYIIDTGINASHPDFAGRIGPGTDLIDGGAPDDCNGHGTHVSGTVGGTTYGVAKGVRIIPVRVFACGNTGATSTIIAGIEWAAANHVAGRPAVANMSLGGGASAAMDTATQNLINDGVATAVAAGNGNLLGNPVSACSQSPARVPAALTVGATDSSDRRASFSNTGTCVDLHAPGVSIVSAGLNGGAATLSGTSMASPHVAGVAAQYLQGNPGAAPATVHSAIVSNATNGAVAISCGLFGCPGGTTTTRLLFTSY